MTKDSIARKNKGMGRLGNVKDVESERSKIEAQIMEWIKDKDLFWLHTMKAELGITAKNKTAETTASIICIRLCKERVLMACERRGNHIQYMVL